MGLRLRSLTLLVLLVAAVSAQQGQFAASVSVEAPADGTGTVSQEQAETFTFTVKNTSPGSGDPQFDANNPADVDVEVRDAPDGWNTGVAPASFRLTPGESKDVVLTVTVTPDAPEEEGTITVAATLTTRLRDLDPILGGGGQSQTASDAATLQLQREESLTRGLLESLGPYVWVILFALLAAVLLSTKLVMDNRRVSVAVSSRSRQVKVKAGGRAAIPLEVRNIGRSDDTVVFQVSPVGDGWAAFLPVAELELPRGAKEELHLVVIAPDKADPGRRQEVLVTASSAQGPRHPASITFDAVVE